MHAFMHFTFLMPFFLSRFVPAGSGMAVGPTLLPLFQQLGIYDEFLKIGKYAVHTKVFKDNLEPYAPSDYTPIEEL